MDILRDVGMSKIRGENGNIEEYIETETVRESQNEEKIETGVAKKRKEVGDKEFG